MSIRVRRIDGKLVALCGAQSTAEEGDIYLDDEVDHAVRKKLYTDFESEDAACKSEEEVMSDMFDTTKTLDECRDELAIAEKERDAFREANERWASLAEDVMTHDFCLYCGESFERPATEDPDGHQLRTHIFRCEKHPIVAFKDRVNVLEGLLEDVRVVLKRELDGWQHRGPTADDLRATIDRIDAATSGTVKLGPGEPELIPPEPKCKTCGGAGRWMSTSANIKEEPQPEIKTCPTCHGTGEEE